MIIDHNNTEYKLRRQATSKYNGAYYYSKEIVKNIIPNVETDRNWITVNIYKGMSNSIVFIHNNRHPGNYEYLKAFKDIVLVCGVGETVNKVKHIGKAIYLPLSIDVAEVEKYKTKKTKDTAFAGRRTKSNWGTLPNGIDYLAGMPRSELLSKMAEYKNIYAVGRTAIEAKALGCKVLPYDERYPNTNRWRVIDNKEAAKILQEKLNKIDGKRLCKTIL